MDKPRARLAIRQRGGEEPTAQEKGNAMSGNAWIGNLPGPRLEAVVAEHGDTLKERHRTSDVYFAVWLDVLDRAVQRRVHMSYMDLEDWDYWAAYNGDMSPKDAAEEMLDDNNYSQYLEEM